MTYKISPPLKAARVMLVIAFCFAGVFAQEPKPATVFDPGAVEVTVVGSYHLRQINQDETPVAGNVIARSLMKYKPDHIVVEWIHPSIDHASTFNYRSLGDLPTLARLWGYQLPKVAEAMDATKRQLEEQKRNSQIQSQTIAATRIELAKLYYLSKDQLNAAYQVWRAQQLGGDVQELKRLTSDQLRGHEIEVFGFEIARAQSLEYITPFDYQGDDVGSEVWDDILKQLRIFVVAKKHGVKESHPKWKELADDFDKDRSAFEEKRDKALGEKYGDIKEVREYMAAFEGYDNMYAQIPKTRDGLSQMRFIQSEQYQAIERKIHMEIVTGISVGGLGAKRTAGNVHRNVRMMDFAEADIKRLGTKRVMIIVGQTHKFFLEDILKKRGYKIVQSSEFMP